MRLTCDEVLSLLDAYDRGELNDGVREAVEAHLALCSACREEQRFLAELSMALPLSYEEYPETLHEDIMASVRRVRAEERRATHRHLAIFGKVAVAILLIVLSVPLFLPFFPTKTPAGVPLVAQPLSSEQGAAFGVRLYSGGANVWETRDNGFAASYRLCYAGDVAVLTIDGKAYTGTISFEENGSAHLCLRDQRIFRLVPTEEGMLLFLEG